MALLLSGYSPDAIMKLGWWRRQTFLTYIHPQFAATTTGTSSRMRHLVEFHNVGGHLSSADWLKFSIMAALLQQYIYIYNH